MINKLYSAGGTTTASLDVRNPGRLTGVFVNILNAASGSWEVSFNSTSQFSTNDATGVICGGTIGASGTTMPGFVNCNEPVDAGERLYLHTTGAGNITNAFLIIEDSTGATRTAVRRR